MWYNPEIAEAPAQNMDQKPSGVSPWEQLKTHVNDPSNYPTMDKYLIQPQSNVPTHMTPSLPPQDHYNPWAIQDSQFKDMF